MTKLAWLPLILVACVPVTGLDRLTKSDRILFARCSEPIGERQCGGSGDGAGRTACLGTQAGLFADQPTRRSRRSWLASHGCPASKIDGADGDGGGGGGGEGSAALAKAESSSLLGEGAACKRSAACESDLCVRGKCATAASLTTAGQVCIATSEAGLTPAVAAAAMSSPVTLPVTTPVTPAVTPSVTPPVAPPPSLPAPQGLSAPERPSAPMPGTASARATATTTPAVAVVPAEVVTAPPPPAEDPPASAQAPPPAPAPAPPPPLVVAAVERAERAAPPPPPRRELPPSGPPPPPLVGESNEGKARQLREIIVGHEPEMKRCVDRQLKLLPTLRAEGTLVLEVDAGGRVAVAVLRGDQLTGTQLETCLRDAAMRWRFPRTARGYAVEAPLRVSGVE